MNLIVSFDDLSSPSPILLKEIFDLGERIISNGGKIVVQQEYTNADPDIIAVYESIDDLKKWKDRISERFPEIDG